MCFPGYNVILLVLCTSCTSKTKRTVFETRLRNGRKTLPHCPGHKTKFCRETNVCIEDDAISKNSIVFQEKYDIMNKVKITLPILPPKSLRINQAIFYMKLF